VGARRAACGRSLRSTLKRLCDDLSLPMSSAHDLLQALVELDAVRLAGQRIYSPGPRSLVLALSIVDAVDLRHVSRPYMTELCEEVNENTYLAVRSGNSVVYADRYDAGQALSVVMKLGGPRPLHGSSIGKLIAAYKPGPRDAGADSFAARKVHAVHADQQRPAP
jgi:DNA-binding IclR family transcriptional regulator